VLRRQADHDVVEQEALGHARRPPTPSRRARTQPLLGVAHRRADAQPHERARVADRRGRLDAVTGPRTGSAPAASRAAARSAGDAAP
jgi:hypothetical protein